MNKSERGGHARQFFFGLMLFMFIDFVGYLFSMIVASNYHAPQYAHIETILPIATAVVMTIVCVVVGFQKNKTYFAIGVLMASVVIFLGIGACNLLANQYL